MLDVKQQIISSLQKAVKEVTNQDLVPILQHASDERHGDYSTNVAMIVFKVSKVSEGEPGWKTPLDLAKKIVDKFMIHNSTLRLRSGQEFIILERVEAVAPGFINFWLSRDYLTTLMIYIIKAKDEYGESKKLENKKIMVEFTDPNPFKEFHIGHLYSNTVGESICRLLEAQNALVWRACYQGDVGLHVAKTLYGLLVRCHAELGSASQSLENEILKQVQDDKRQVQDDNLDERVKFLGEAYAFGTKAYEEDSQAKREIEKINKQIYQEYPAIMPLYEKGRAWSLEYFDLVYKRLGTKFKKFYLESEAGKQGLEIVKKNIGKIFEESNGAVIFPGEKYGLHNRVFINSLGLPTYEAKDLGLAPTKYKDFPYDLSIIITANEQSGYFKVILKALSLIQPALAQKTKHIAHGVVRLPMGKMSSRTGTIITGEWLLDETKRRIRDQYKEMDEETSEKVAVGAVKYALLKSGIGRDIAFDFDESISLEGNSGPYLQYTYARTQSVLKKIKNQKSKIKNTTQNLKLENEEVSLLRSLHKFPEVVGGAAENFAPNILCNYLFDLAQKFNLFYQKIPIIKGGLPRHSRESGNQILSQAENDKIRELRLTLTQAVGQVIKNGLYLLGIQSPERM